MPHHFLRIGMLASLSFWLLASCVHYFSFSGQGFEFIPSDFNELWPRLGAGGLLILFGWYADHAKRKHARGVERSETQFSDLMENSPDITWRIDSQGTLTYVSPSVSYLFGFEPEELVGLPLGSLFPDSESSQIARHIMTQRLKGDLGTEAITYEFRYQRKDGTSLVMECRSIPITGKNGQIVEEQGTARDITERKHVEEELRNSEKRNRAWLEHSPACTKIVDLDFNLQYMSSAGVVGLKIDDITKYYGKPYPLEFYPESFRKEMNENLRRVKETGEIKAQEGSVFDLEGNELWFHSTLVPVRDDENRIDHIMIVSIDTTDRNRAEEESERFGQALEESLNEVYFFDSQTLHFVNVNHASIKNLGYSIEELRTLTPVDIEPEFTLDAFTDLVEPLRTGDQTKLEFSTVHRRKDGTLYPVEVHLQLTGESPPVFVAIILDITDRIRAEEERLDLVRQVQHTQKLESLGVLAGGIAHDFNNILTSILGNADLALNELSPHAPARQNILEIEKASRRAADLAKQMLAYSGKGRFVIEPIALNEFIGEMTHLLDVSISKKAVLKCNFADNLPTFDGDATQIRQIIMNLIINASEAIGDKSGFIALSTGAMYCDDTSVTAANGYLCAGLEKSLIKGTYVYLEVADTGIGMDNDTIEKIFDPFFTTKFTGRGLGMSAVLGIVRGHKGAIKVSSELRKGTTFRILFPANESVDKGLVTQPEEVSGRQDWRGSGTILIADDEDTVCAVGKEMLEHMGFSVLTAPDGREAVAVYREHTSEIVCVLLDLTMPHMDGEDAFREIRLIEPDAKVILCSGYNMHDATQRFAGKGLAGFLQKPFNMAELKEIFMEIMGDENGTVRDE